MRIDWHRFINNDAFRIERKEQTIAGTQRGGVRASKTNKRKYGDDYYARIGSIGGRAVATKPKGFAAMSLEKRQEAGRKGGKISRRGKSPKTKSPDIDHGIHKIRRSIFKLIESENG